MYAQFTTFLLAKGKHADADAIAARVETVMKELKGFKSVTFVADKSIGEYGIFSVWDSVTDALSAGQNLSARFQQELKDDHQAASTLRMFEVFSPAVDQD